MRNEDLPVMPHVMPVEMVDAWTSEHVVVGVGMADGELMVLVQKPTD